MDPFERLRSRLARDDAVSEVVSYTLMFAMGSAALVFSMEMLVDAQERGSDIASAKQVNQLGQATATLVQDASRAAHNAPNASFHTTVTLPEAMAGRNYTIQLHVPDEPTPRGPSNPCWNDFWDPVSLGTCPDTHVGCPTNAEVHVATGDDQIDKVVRLSNVTSGEVVDGTCLVLNTTESVTSTAGALRVLYERGAYPEITLETANR